jgi:hypothetical protein
MSLLPGRSRGVVDADLAPNPAGFRFIRRFSEMREKSPV